MFGNSKCLFTEGYKNYLHTIYCKVLEAEDTHRKEETGYFLLLSILQSLPESPLYGKVSRWIHVVHIDRKRVVTRTRLCILSAALRKYRISFYSRLVLT